MFPSGILLKAGNTSNNLTFFVCLLSHLALSTHCCFPIDQLLSFAWVLLRVCECMLSTCFLSGQTFPAVLFLDVDYFYYLLYVAMEMGRFPDVKSWNLGLQETFIIVIHMK